VEGGAARGKERKEREGGGYFFAINLEGRCDGVRALEPGSERSIDVEKKKKCTI
jgi:hypothetical protein